MSGHSHWAGIRHKKGINDAKRASAFTKLGKAIIVAAQQGGGNPETNFSLRLAIDQARAMNMPKENIERAVKRGSGETKGDARLEEPLYEAFGPANTALLIETATDNKNRTVSELRTLLTKTGGKMGNPGAVNFLFKRVSRLLFEASETDRETVELLAIEADAEDFSFSAAGFSVFGRPDQLQEIKIRYQDAGFPLISADLGYVPLQEVELGNETRSALEKLREALEEHPDVQAVWDNSAPPSGIFV